MPGRSAESGEGYRYGYQGQFAEEDGQANWLSFELRNYDPRIARWTSIDPAEQFHSPYVAMGNDPVNMIDRDGAMAFGPTTTIVSDNGDGTYTVEDWIDDGSTDVVLQDGTKIGESLTEYSFVNITVSYRLVDEPGTRRGARLEKVKNYSVVEGAIIDMNSTEGQDFLDKNIIGNDDLGLYDYMINATGGEKYDFKTVDIEDRPVGVSRTQYKYRASVMSNGKIATARDIGNWAAGYVAGSNGLPYAISRIGLDGLESWQQRRRGFRWWVETEGTRYAQWAGHRQGLRALPGRFFRGLRKTISEGTLFAE